MDASDFFIDPAFCFDPNDLGQLPQLEQSSLESFPCGDASSMRRKIRIRASRACIPCRSRHMKCDSIEPTCTRCQLEEKTCIYAKSRRGGSNRIDSLQKSFDRPQSQPSQTSQRPAGSRPASGCHSLSIDGFTPSPPGHSSASFSNFGGSVIDECSMPRPEKLISRYYDFFHNAHPFLLPRAQFCIRLREDPNSLEHLFPILEFIGSIFLPDVPTDPFQERAHNILSASTLPMNGFSVQALAIFALALHCSDEFKIAEQFLDKAIDIALSINMHRQSFAVEHGEGDPSLQESWRRTWWSIYVLDGLFAAVSHYPTHRLQGIEEEVDLPCEDYDYEKGCIPPSRTLIEYDNREFSDDPVVFSSLAYLIDAGRILSSNMSVNCEARQPGDGVLAAADAKFVNWYLYLPESKKSDELVREDQKVDEVMFFAHVMINTLKLVLHRPHSRLAFSPIETQSKCTPPSPAHQPAEVILSITLHTAKAVEALSTSISLFALPAPYLHHSPLTSCSLALAVMAQVSACNNIFRPGTPAYKASRDRIRLGLGALRANMEYWFMASRTVREVVKVARELLQVENSPKSAALITSSGGNEAGYFDNGPFLEQSSLHTLESFGDGRFGSYDETSARAF